MNVRRGDARRSGPRPAPRDWRGPWETPVLMACGLSLIIWILVPWPRAFAVAAMLLAVATGTVLAAMRVTSNVLVLFTIGFAQLFVMAAPDLVQRRLSVQDLPFIPPVVSATLCALSGAAVILARERSITLHNLSGSKWLAWIKRSGTRLDKIEKATTLAGIGGQIIVWIMGRLP